MQLVAPIAKAHRDRAGYHAASVAGVILVHLLLLTLLLRNGPIVIAPLAKARETILTLIPDRPKIGPRKTASANRKPTRTKSPASSPQPSWVFPALPPKPTTAPTDLSGIATALFNCAPENIASLPRDARSACVNASKWAAFEPPIPGTLRIRSQDGAVWAAAIVDRNTPGRVPCVSLGNVVTNGIQGKSKVELGVDIFCAAGLALHARELFRKTHLSD